MNDDPTGINKEFNAFVRRQFLCDLTGGIALNITRAIYFLTCLCLMIFYVYLSWGEALWKIITLGVVFIIVLVSIYPLVKWVLITIIGLPLYYIFSKIYTEDKMRNME